MAKNPVEYYKQYEYISRYESFPYLYDKYNNRYYYGITSNLDKNTPYASYVVKVGDTYDSIAYDLYGSPLFYWIICNFNDVQDCFAEPEVGSIIKVPSLNLISFKD